MSEKLTIGFVHKGYREKRNFLFVTKNTYKQIFDYNKLISYFIFKVRKKTNYKYLNSFNDWGVNSYRYDILHLFHGVNQVRKPWVLTFSSVMPRDSKNTLKDVERMAGPYCKRMIALSANAKNILLNYIQSNFPKYAEDIRRKIIVLHPPQKKLISKKEQKEIDKKIKFCLIGADFFRKGGKEILKAFNQLEQEGILNWELIIVSSLQFGDYATKTHQQDQSDALEEINRNKNITYYSHLPNEEVLDILKNTHVGLLPTWADTYGYSVLEAQACGCPVITTDIRVMPEINNEECGWVINVPKDELGNGILQKEKDRESFSDQLARQLYEIIHSILNSPEQIEKKSVASIARITKYHDPVSHAVKLEEIYHSALTL